MAGKELKAPCTEKCPFKCSTKFNKTERQSIFQEFWASGDKREQNYFLLRHAKELPIKRARVGSMKRMRTFHYFFNTSDCKREEVCRTFFINTLDIKRELVYSVLRRQTSTGGMTPSLQGKHGNQRRTGENILQAVADHINSFPIVESHYCRARTVKRYLDPSLSVSAMYRLYTDLCESKGLEKVSQDKYRKIFDYDFNFGFHRPKKDQCEVCIVYQHRQDQATAEEKKDYSTHMNNKITARQIKDNAKKDACLSSTATKCEFDLQQILLCPHGKSSSFFLQETVRCLQSDCL